jgi:hypothetical protein
MADFRGDDNDICVPSKPCNGNYLKTDPVPRNSV